MNMKKLLAMLVTICLLLAVSIGVLAEADQSEDLAQILQGNSEGDGIEHVEVTDLAVTEGLSEDWVNILLLGTDSGASAHYANTDIMIVLSTNSQTGQMKMTSILRDTMVEIPGHGQKGLRSACLYGGPELTINLINKNLGLNIEQYAMVDMKCLVDIVDMLGGLTLDISEEESKAISQLNEMDTSEKSSYAEFAAGEVPAGEQVLLNGRQVLAYARIRQTDSDYARAARQRTVLVKLVGRLQQEDPFTLAAILTSMLEYVETNMGFDQIMWFASMGIGISMDSIADFRVPVDGTYDTGIVNDTWGLVVDFEENTRLLHNFIYG